MALLPPLRLTGATILRDGALRQRSLAIERGRITRGPLPAVDLDGYLLLPGIVDLSGGGLAARLAGGASPMAAISAAGRDAAAAGITTCWLRQGWGWQGGTCDPAMAEAVMAALARHRPRARADLRLHLRVESHLPGSAPALIEAVQRGGASLVIFANTADAAAEVLRSDPERFAAEARRRGRSPEAHAAALGAALASARAVPRHLCTLAEAFDRAGIAYGSHGDPGGETRERFSMIGARIADSPRALVAAAAAGAMGDPVILPPPAAEGAAPACGAAADILAAGLGDALISDGDAPALAAGAFALCEAGLRDLPRAWAMISTRPAEIMRCPDRGTLDYGRRADVAVVNAQTRRVEATICGGRLTHLAGAATERFRAALGAAAPLALFAAE